jgi:MATE family multidrug resistance protein
MVLTNLGQVAIQTTDIVMIGRLGAPELAASALSTYIFFALFLFAVGVTSAVSPMIAQDLGRSRHTVREPRRTMRQGFWAVLMLGLPTATLLWHIDLIFGLLRQDETLAHLALPYARGIAVAFVPAVGFVLLRNFIGAFQRPAAALVVGTIGVGVNALAAYALIFGHMGMPRLGLMGAGIATALTNSLQFLTLLAFVMLDRRFRRYRLLGHFFRPDWGRFVELWRLGLPIGLVLLVEVALFAGSGFMMGWVGTVQLAAYQIALQCANVTFMVPLGIAQAATVRVGLAVGRKDAAGAGRAGFAAIGLGMGFMAAMGVIMVTMPMTIASLFLDFANPGAFEVAGYVATFLFFAALFQTFDAGQVIGVHALRGLKDTDWPLAIGIFAYWVVGLGGGIFLAFGADFGAVGIWMGMVGALVVAASSMIIRFAWMQRRLDFGPAAPLLKPDRLRRS